MSDDIIIPEGGGGNSYVVEKPASSVYVLHHDGCDNGHNHGVYKINNDPYMTRKTLKSQEFQNKILYHEKPGIL